MGWSTKAYSTPMGSSSKPRNSQSQTGHRDPYGKGARDQVAPAIGKFNWSETGSVRPLCGWSVSQTTRSKSGKIKLIRSPDLPSPISKKTKKMQEHSLPKIMKKVTHGCQERSGKSRTGADKEQDNLSISFLSSRMPSHGRSAQHAVKSAKKSPGGSGSGRGLRMTRADWLQSQVHQ